MSTRSRSAAGSPDERSETERRLLAACRAALETLQHLRQRGILGPNHPVLDMLEEEIDRAEAKQRHTSA